MSRFSLLCGCALVLAPVPAFAGNDDGVLVGSEAAVTAGALTATVSSGAALWYNPAGLAHYNEHKLDMGGTAMNIRLYRAPSAVVTDQGEAGELRVNDIVFIPPAATVVWPIGGRHRFLGVGALTTSFSESLSRTNFVSPRPDGNELSVSLWREVRYALYHVPVGYAVELTPNLSVGVTLQGVVASQHESWGVGLIIRDPSTGASSDVNTNSGFYSELGLGLRASLGFQWRLARHWSIGASALSPSYMFFRSTIEEGIQVTTLDDGTQSTLPTSEESRELGLARFEPLRVRFGVAHLLDFGWISAEGDFSTPRTDEYFRRSAGWVYNARLGAYMKVSPGWLVGGGVFTDRQNFTGPLPPGEYRINYAGATLGARWSNDGLARGQDLEFGITLAPRYAYGEGKVGAIITDSAEASVASVTDADAVHHEIGLYWGTDLIW